MRLSWSRQVLTALFLMLIIPLRTGVAGDGTSMDRFGHRSVAPREWVPRGIAMSAAGDLWRSAGPTGGDVGALAVSPTKPSLVLAGIYPTGGGWGGGLYRSEDDGVSWQAVVAFNEESVHDLEFADDGTAYLAGNYGAWSSSDDGATWSRFDLGIGMSQMAFDIEIDPADQQRIWVGAYDFQGNYFVMRSLDRGASWDDVTPAAMGDRNCNGFAFHPADPNRVYACFGRFDGAAGFYVSTDYGASWIDRTPYLPAYRLTDVEFVGGRVLVTGGQLYASQHVGLLATVDDGVTWNALHDASWPVLVHNDIEADPDDPEVLYLTSEGAGVYRSLDGGLTWDFGVGGTDGLSVQTVCFNKASSTTVYLGLSSHAVFKSDDGGASFQPSSGGISALWLYGIDANPLDLDELAVSFQTQNSGGVYSSLDGGLTWNLESCPASRWNAVRFAPDGTLYALNDGPSTITGEGVYRRENDGTWTELGPNQGALYDTELFSIRFSKTDPDLIVIGGGDSGSQFGYEATIWISEDAGATWTKTYEAPSDGENVIGIEIVEDGEDRVMVAAFDDLGSDEGYTGGVLRSTDGGWTWAETSLGGLFPIRMPRLAAVPGQPSTFYVGDLLNGGLYRTPDSGLNWVYTGYAGVVLTVVADPHHDEVLYIGDSTAPRIRRSENSGSNFTAFDGGLDAAGRPEVLAARTGDRTLLMLATRAGAYLHELALSSVPEPAGDDPWLRCSPNPFNPVTTLTFELPRRETVRLQVFDLGGRLVRTLIDGEVLDQGRHEEVWRGRDNDGRPMASGTYFSRLEAGAHSESQPMVLVK